MKRIQITQKIVVRALRRLLYLVLLVAWVKSPAQEIRGWGRNFEGQLNTPPGVEGVVSVSSGYDHSMALLADGTVAAWGNNEYGKATVPDGLTDVVAISAGPDHSLALKSDGTVVAWGDNADGKATVPNGLTNVVAVAALDFSSVALRADGTVAAWGFDGFNMVSGAAGLSGIKAIASCPYYNPFVLALKHDGTVVAWGSNGDGQCNVPVGLSDVIAVAAGGGHSLALKSDGTVVAWGRNSDRQCDVPPDLKDVIAISATRYLSLALKSDGTVVAWNYRGINGEGVVPAGLSGVTAISAGAHHVLTVGARQHRVTGWGLTNNGQLNIPSDLGQAGVKGIAGGRNYSAALLPDGSVIAWGGSPSNLWNVPAALGGVTKAISGGSDHAVGLKADGTVVVWGANNWDQHNIPVGLTGVIKIAAGTNHTLALKSDGTVVAWGQNLGGQCDVPVGLVGVVAIAAGSQHSMALKADGTVVAWGANSFSQLNVPGGLAGNVKEIAAGDFNSMALRSNGDVVTWGNIATAFSGVKTISSSFSHNLALKSDGTVEAAGNNAFGQTDVPPGTVNVKSIATGSGFSLAIMYDHVPIISGNTTTATYVEGASPIALEQVQSFTHNTGDLAGVTVSITGGFTLGDILDVTAPSLTKDYNASTGTLTVTGTAAISTYQNVIQSLTYHAEGDAPALNATRTVRVTATDGYQISDPLTFSINVTAVNDAPSFTKGSDVTINEDAPAQDFANWATGISSGPSDEAGQTVNFIVTNDHNELFSVQPSISPTGRLTFAAATNANGTATVTVRINDNGGTANGGVNQSADQTFTITIDPVNDAPSFNKGSDIVLSEDAGPQIISNWATAISEGVANESSQALTFNVSNDNNSLFTVLPSIDPSGELVFTPADNMTGAATVTVSLSDNGGTANGGLGRSGDQVFTITVNAINDPPSFTKGIDIILNEDAGPQTISDWATGISSGPADESAQLLEFIVSNDNNSLFSMQPSVDASGVLSFTPAPQVTGVATVTIMLQDNGGGANQSDSEAFTIYINNVNDEPSFTAGQDVVVNEDTPAYNSIWATDILSGDVAQTVIFILAIENPDLFAVQPSVSSSGILSFEPAPDAFGSSVVTVYLKDDGGTTNGGVDQSAPIDFNITINPVNDAPVIDPADDLSVGVNSAPITIQLTGIHAGAGEDQQLTIEAFSDNTSLVTDLMVTPLQQGTMSVTLVPSTGNTGTATITIKLKDNGGTASGGIDETLLSFILTVEDEVQAVFIPTLFTPDANGMNDTFRVRGAGIQQIQFKIYNTQGQELFSTSDITEATETGWTGKYNGKDQPAGTYIWTLQGKYTSGQPLTNDQNRHGQVILVR